MSKKEYYDATGGETGIDESGVSCIGILLGSILRLQSFIVNKPTLMISLLRYIYVVLYVV